EILASVLNVIVIKGLRAVGALTVTVIDGGIGEPSVGSSCLSLSSPGFIVSASEHPKSNAAAAIDNINRAIFFIFILSAI
ncbi:MAG: hypothetical protein FWG49_03500, partial [Leptospirales bacterium]|nr:hypothetical protein [Leptospirales bacterium]